MRPVFCARCSAPQSWSRRNQFLSPRRNPPTFSATSEPRTPGTSRRSASRPAEPAVSAASSAAVAAAISINSEPNAFRRPSSTFGGRTFTPCSPASAAICTAALSAISPSARRRTPAEASESTVSAARASVSPASTAVSICSASASICASATGPHASSSAARASSCCTRTTSRSDSDAAPIASRRRGAAMTVLYDGNCRGVGVNGTWWCRSRRAAGAAAAAGADGAGAACWGTVKPSIGRITGASVGAFVTSETRSSRSWSAPGCPNAIWGSSSAAATSGAYQPASTNSFAASAFVFSSAFRAAASGGTGSQ